MAFEKVINKINVLSVFDGISAGRLALQRANIEVNTYYRSEIEKHASKVAMSHFPNDLQLGDVTKWREWDLDWSSIDLLIGGSPCQGFSFAGKQAGTLASVNGEMEIVATREKYLELKARKENLENIIFLSESYLFWEYVLILDHIKSHNPNVKFLLENVKMKKELLQMIDDAMGIKSVVINSALLSAQNRVRHYWCNWEVKQPDDKGILLRDILEGGIDCDRACERIKDGDAGHIANATDIKGMDCIKRVYGQNGKAPTLTTMGGGHREPKVIVSNTTYRKLTPTECARLQTFPDRWCESVVSKTQSYKAYGNSWTVDIIAHIFKELKVELIKEDKLAA